MWTYREQWIMLNYFVNLKNLHLRYMVYYSKMWLDFIVWNLEVWLLSLIRFPAKIPSCLGRFFVGQHLGWGHQTFGFWLVTLVQVDLLLQTLVWNNYLMQTKPRIAFGGSEVKVKATWVLNLLIDRKLRKTKSVWFYVPVLNSKGLEVMKTSARDEAEKVWSWQKKLRSVRWGY